jgi:hypothetical protein
MTLIRVFETWDVTTLPLKRNLVLRFTKGREKLKKMMKDALVREFRECQNSREEDLHSLPCSFSFRCG